MEEYLKDSELFRCTDLVNLPLEKMTKIVLTAGRGIPVRVVWALLGYKFYLAKIKRTNQDRDVTFIEESHEKNLVNDTPNESIHTPQIPSRFPQSLLYE